ncbi:uncharacterized protein [Zea mays]|nr:uncharacterized protein LOC103638290 isoform X3 [Zea mays]AQL03206.1 hypothetical protein ZEAMMB73_Zm00001d045787 [Zea mays]|eukprot:XP_020400045.1 uncharacterized protein LOC103638290 isoform X3 [Zea mays]
MARGMRKCIIQSQEEYLVEEPIGETSHRPRDAAYDHHPSARERQKESDNGNEFNDLDHHKKDTTSFETTSGVYPSPDDADIEDSVEGQTNEAISRGPNKLKHVWNLQKGKRIVVNCNELGQPIGEEAGVLGKFLGMVARNGCLCSLSFKDWRLLIGKKDRNNEQKNKQDVLKQVKMRFLYLARMEKWILRTIGERWRQHKSNLKSLHFDAHRSKENNLKNVPKGVLDDQWVALVNNWFTTKSQDISEANRINCTKRKATHTSGTKSFARNREDMREQDPEKKYPHRAVLYINTHKSNITKNTNPHVVALKELLVQEPSLADTSHGKVAWKGDALSQILGEEKPGHIHGLGLVPNPDQVFGGSTSRHLKHLNLTSLDATSSEDVVSLRLQVEKLIDRVQKQDDTILNLQNTLELQKSHHECLDEPLSASKDLQPTMNQKINLLDELNSTMADEIKHDGYEELQAQCKKSKIQEKGKPPMPRGGLQGGRVSTSLNVKNRSNAAKVMNQDTARNSSNHEPYKNKGSLENYLPSTKDDQSTSKRKRVYGQFQSEEFWTLDENHETIKPLRGDTLQPSRISTGLKVGSHIFLKSWRNQNKKVALGTIIGCDPKQQVGGDPLGKEFWKVRLGLVLVRDEPLIRPYNNFVVLGDIDNDPIAWPSSCIEKAAL